MPSQTFYARPRTAITPRGQQVLDSIAATVRAVPEPEGALEIRVDGESFSESEQQAHSAMTALRRAGFTVGDSLQSLANLLATTVEVTRPPEPAQKESSAAAVSRTGEEWYRRRRATSTAKQKAAALARKDAILRLFADQPEDWAPPADFLAQCLRTNRQRTAEVLRELTEDGLVECTTPRRPERLVRVKLTDEGRRQATARVQQDVP